MTPGLGRSASARSKLLLLVAGPLGVLLVSFVAAWAMHLETEQERLDAYERAFRRRFEVLMLSAAAVADQALAAADRVEPADLARGPLGARLEGTAILAPDGRFDTWTGTPSNRPVRFLEPDRPRWSIQVDGVRTRLVARSGPDPGGRWAIATFVIDSTLPDRAFRRLLPEQLKRDVELAVDFLDTEIAFSKGSDFADEPPEPRRALPDTHAFWLSSPDGQPLAGANVLPLDTSQRAARVRRTGMAWSTVLAILLLAWLFDWRALGETAGGATLTACLVLGARATLSWESVPARLLPRELATASLCGTPGWLGLLASPADLLLSALAIFLLCLIASRYAASTSRSHRSSAATFTAAVSILATALAAGLAVSIVRNSRIPLLERPAPFVWDGRLLLWLAIVLALLGAAELWARLAAILRARSGGRPRAPRLAVALVFVVLAAACSLMLQELNQQLNLEQLASDFAPQVRDQRARRGVVLLAAMRQLEDRLLHHDPRDVTLSSRPSAMAYYYWSTGELFQSGFRSSLNFYTPNGQRLSSFSFGLPPFEEHLLSDESWPPGLPLEKAESVEDLAADLNMIHVEIRVVQGDEPRGVIVGHVLDEPDNLPFLPWSQPYLAALGPGSPRAGREFPGNLHYALYDAADTVQLTTLARPPAQIASLRQAASEGKAIRVTADGRRYFGLALVDEDEQLHLLLLPSVGPLKQFAIAVRISLLGLLLIVSLGLAARLARPGGARALIQRLTDSFYRKLLVALLVVSGLPLIGLALFLSQYVETRADSALIASASQLVSAAQRVVEDYSAVQVEGGEEQSVLDDLILYWLRGIVGQEIHVYENGELLATSKRELFDSGLLPLRLDGTVQQRLVSGGLSTLVVRSAIGPSTIPVAYAPVDTGRGPRTGAIAVPLVLEQRQIGEATAQVGEMILIATVALVGLLAFAAAALARTVARPVRELVDATGRIAAGDYSARLEPRTSDELAELVRSFNTMGSALNRQRTDLRRQRDYMETLLRHDTTGIISVDAEGMIITINPAAAELLGARFPADIVGRSLDELLTAREGMEPLARALARPLRGGEPVEVDLHERDDPVRRFQMVRVELRGERGVGVGTLILLDDVTDLMRSNQLAAWAEMAQVIAHEIKNPLTPIQLSSEHLSRLLEDRGVLPAREIEACIETIIKQVRTLYEIAGEFSTYAKLPALVLERTDPVEFARATFEPYRRSKPPGVNVVEDYEPSPHVALDARVLSRALVNLLENALQAMPDGGELALSVRHDSATREVVISVRDSGPGLAPDVRRRLFEPYFSTKSSGTGLGLAIVSRAVEGHGGRIEVASSPNSGTTFHIRLPALDASRAVEGRPVGGG